MCLFCEILNQPHLHNKPEDKIIDESDNFYAKPALGQFIKGYTLINTKKHMPNMAYVDKYKFYDELQTFVEKVKYNISKYTKSEFVVFEHGSINKFCSGINCRVRCIDHAHIHIVPVRVNVIEILKKKFEYKEITKIHDLKRFKDISYIYYQHETQHLVFYVEKHIQSQYVRKIICDELKISEYWNWSQYPFRENIIEFLTQYPILHTFNSK